MIRKGTASIQAVQLVGHTGTPTKERLVLTATYATSTRRLAVNASMTRRLRARIEDALIMTSHTVLPTKEWWAFIAMLETMTF
jgi:hypothetical protein